MPASGDPTAGEGGKCRMQPGPGTAAGLHILVSQFTTAAARTCLHLAVTDHRPTSVP